MSFQKGDAGKPRIGLIPPEAVLEVAEVLTHGANKYGASNWAQGAEWSRYFDAAQRHLWAWQSGEDKDQDSSLSHLAHAVCSLCFLIAYQQRGLGQDDRCTPTQSSSETPSLPPVKLESIEDLAKRLGVSDFSVSPAPSRASSTVTER